MEHLCPALQDLWHCQCRCARVQPAAKPHPGSSHPGGAQKQEQVKGVARKQHREGWKLEVS